MQVDLSLLGVFLSTFLVASMTPGMCMTFATALGMSIGFRRSLWMMVGELLGLALVVISVALGVAQLLLAYPSLFKTFKYLGGIYLLYLGIELWKNKGQLAIKNNIALQKQLTPINLVSKGFIIAIANPKCWGFLVVLLPPFLSEDYPVLNQLFVYLPLILIIELFFLILYASGGKALSLFLEKQKNVKLINRVTGSLMILLATWLAFY